MICDTILDQLRSGAHGDPFAVLGLHPGDDGTRRLRCFLPGAAQVDVLAPPA